MCKKKFLYFCIIFSFGIFSCTNLQEVDIKNIQGSVIEKKQGSVVHHSNNLKNNSVDIKTNKEVEEQKKNEKSINNNTLSDIEVSTIIEENIGYGVIWKNYEKNIEFSIDEKENTIKLVQEKSDKKKTIETEYKMKLNKDNEVVLKLTKLPLYDLILVTYDKDTLVVNVPTSPISRKDFTFTKLSIS